MSTLEYGAGRGSASQAFWRLAARREIGLAILLVLILATATVRSADFLSLRNIRDILANCSQTAVISCGVMLVIVTGEIDISVGSALGFLTAILGTMVAPTDAPVAGFGWPVWVGILLTLLIGTAIGTLNGVLVTLVRVPSIIAAHWRC